ncbi:hypothetical protein PO654_26420 [Phytobacter diazotrophicus]|uniref:Uncharacterized protein n=1 Tax=Phytobacter ursingii TaxID=1972431 RepID=A0AB35RW45_9ENTR|nr:hypothetical protein [Phytobacter ursingii]AUU93179.1 hypothetical protein C2U55_29425 [Enterobacteriaceae bacterium ENNIH3]MDU4154871.1 hypothetical protein [Enterobacteriaceae bacterium]MDV2865821.1 hypothetical protein [Phytobacter ursingii]QIH66824.1 hypothetical protein CRX67_28035 [Enterobacteriaceae bacterium A-F18]
MNVKTEKELASAIEKNESTITIEGDLARKTVRIKATGTVAWVIAFGSIGIAFYAAIATVGTGGAAAPATAVSALAGTGAAFGVLGTAATTAAISMAVSVRSLSVLKKLRGDYKITKKSEGIVVLRRK